MTRLALVVVLLCGCLELDAPAPSAELDEAFFRCRVQPVLTKYCATFACHGDGRRYYRVFARNRLRLGIADESERNIALNGLERSTNYEFARAMVVPGDPANSLLLTKPLEEAAGGRYHVGADLYALGDVFADREDRDFIVLEDWVMGAREDPTCVEPGSE